MENIELNGDIIALNTIYRENGKIIREDIEKVFNCSKTTAIRKLNNYVEREILKQIDNGNKTYYELILK